MIIAVRMPGWRLLSLVLVLFALSSARAAESRIEFTKETLDNGLRVIYAPLRNAPVVQVRVLYHVGSRDERPDRQGFAHMFEHMMFRGSAHVPPEEHMKLIGDVGGDSNAFTSFDQTVYHQSLPASNLEMALYLEADRMASFKVNDEIFQTERKVVAEEWRMRYANQPMGSLFQDIMKTAFTTHSYRWLPIGDMDQLLLATSGELQAFFNTYYIPNNACLIIAGDLDVEQAKQWVRKYFAWMPRGPEIVRQAKSEPEQTESRRLIVFKPNIPLTSIYMAFKSPDYRSPDQYALNLLGDILSSGRTGRLDWALVYGATPKCVSVGAGPYQLEDPALFLVNATVQKGADPEEVEKDLLANINEVIEKGVTQEELDKVRTQYRKSVISGRETAEEIADQLGDEEIFGGDANRVNEVIAQVDAISVADIQRVAQKYLKTSAMTVVQYRPGVSTTQPAAVATSIQPVVPRVSTFPEGYPTQPPINREPLAITFNKGIESTVEGVRVITLEDKRLPLVSFSLVFRGGSDAEPAGKEGLAGLTAQMLRRGSENISFLELSAELESHGIEIDVAPEGDNTRLNVTCMTDQLEYAVERAKLILQKPTFPEAELDKLKRQAIGRLTQSLSEPGVVADRQLKRVLYEGSALGRLGTPESLAGVTIEDVKKWYEAAYALKDAFIVFSGDISAQKGEEVARALLAEYPRREAPPAGNYGSTPASKRRIVLVNNPDGKQATIRFGLRAFDIRTDDKFPGMIAGQVLSSGIDSRLNKYVRAEKGLTYGTYAYFRPGRHAGDFSGSLDTNPATAAAAIEAVLEVFDRMRKDVVTESEMADAKLRVAGSMAMDVQTAAQQASRRAVQVLNDYPIDYYDVLPRRIAQVGAPEVKSVMDKYVRDDQMLIVVVAPAAEVKAQLEKLGAVEVVPMPLAEPVP